MDGRARAAAAVVAWWWYEDRGRGAEEDGYIKVVCFVCLFVFVGYVCAHAYV